MKILTVNTLNSHLFTLKAHITKSCMLLSSAEIFEASLTNIEDPDQTAPVHTVCLYTYVNQETDIFGCSYFAGILMVKSYFQQCGV